MSTRVFNPWAISRGSAGFPSGIRTCIDSGCSTTLPSRPLAVIPLSLQDPGDCLAAADQFGSALQYPSALKVRISSRCENAVATDWNPGLSSRPSRISLAASALSSPVQV